MASLETLRQRKSEAETALHALMTGENAVVVYIDGVTRTEFQPIDVDKLTAYIARLGREIAAASAASGVAGGRPRRAIWPSY